MKESRIGRKLNMLTVIERLPDGKYMCRCDCGTKKAIAWEHLRRGNTKSCGCLRGTIKPAEQRNHQDRGVSIRKHALYQTWRGMLRRCYDQNHEHYHRYGGRGITVCDDWRTDFWKFVDQLPPRMVASATLDRLDNNGNYEPGNVWWSTSREQYLNSATFYGVLVNGERYTLPMVAQRYGLTAPTIREHIKKAGSPAAGVARAILAKALFKRQQEGKYVHYDSELTKQRIQAVMNRYRLTDT